MVDHCHGGVDKRSQVVNGEVNLLHEEGGQRTVIIYHLIKDEGLWTPIDKEEELVLDLAIQEEVVEGLIFRQVGLQKNLGCGKFCTPQR